MRKRIKIAAAVLAAVLCILGVLYACITFEITLQTTGEGRLYAEKQRVHLFESVKIRIVPSDAPTPYVLKSVSVNGEDCTKSVHLQTLKISRVHRDIVVTAEFESAAGKAVPANAPTFV
ncbi:MAG: hypothetical protein ACI4LB_09600 [Candidatus Fimenecus sp.]